MDPEEIRELNGLEVQQALYIWSQSFEAGDRKMEKWREWERRAPSGRTTYGIFDGDVLQASFLLIDEAVYLGEQAQVPMSSVCGVGVLPASRGKGLASRGVRFLFEQMRDTGRPISYLEPFSWQFYQGLGYAWIAPTRRYSIPARLLPASPESDRVRAARPDDHSRVIRCYTSAAQRYRGMLARREEVWASMFDASDEKFTYTYIYEADGEIEGYLIYHGGSSKETSVDELIALTARARSGLLGLMRRHDMQTESFRWLAAAEDTLWNSFVHRQLKTRLICRTMARMADVRAALQLMRPAAGMGEKLLLGVVDEHAPWNHGTWTIDCEERQVDCSETRSAAQVTLPVQALAQLYLGAATASELRAAGEIEVADEGGFAVLSRLMAGPPGWCCDTF